MSKLKGIEGLFNGRHFDREVIVVCVRWYLRYKLSFRDLVEMMAERGLSLAHTTIMRWVKRFTAEFVKRWNRLAMAAGQSWRVDETYVKIRGKWVYLYRAVDWMGKTVDFRLRTRRDIAACKAFLAKAIRQSAARSRIDHAGRLRRVSPRGARDEGRWAVPQAYEVAIVEVFEQPDRAGSSPHQIAGDVMLGFKRFRNAAVTISGIELIHRIRKDQFDLTNLRLKETTARAVWMAVLSAL